MSVELGVRSYTILKSKSYKDSSTAASPSLRMTRFRFVVILSEAKDLSIFFLRTVLGVVVEILADFFYSKMSSIVVTTCPSIESNKSRRDLNLHS